MIQNESAKFHKMWSHASLRILAQTELVLNDKYGFELIDSKFTLI